MALQRRNNNVVRLDDETTEMLKGKAGNRKMEIFIKHMVETYEKGTIERPRVDLPAELCVRLMREAEKHRDDITVWNLIIFACQLLFDIDEEEREYYIERCYVSYLGVKINKD